MSARRATAPTVPTLTDADVDDLRRRLGAGESPRVVVRAPSAAVPEGTRGTVVRLGDPAQDEYVVVRIGRDEVPFGPAELSLPGAKPVAAASDIKPVRTPTPRRTPKASSDLPAPATRRPKDVKRSPAPLTVTLRFAAGEWTAEAARGARRVTRPAPVRPGAVSALAEHLDDPALREALIETVAACRAVIEGRAAELRAQLQDAEAALRDYNPRPRR